MYLSAFLGIFLNEEVPAAGDHPGLGRHPLPDLLDQADVLRERRALGLHINFGGVCSISQIFKTFWKSDSEFHENQFILHERL